MVTVVDMTGRGSWEECGEQGGWAAATMCAGAESGRERDSGQKSKQDSGRASERATERASVGGEKSRDIYVRGCKRPRSWRQTLTQAAVLQRTWRGR